MALVSDTAGVSVPSDGITVVLGAQWGDEGKGKLVDILCDNIDVCARCQGGNNAGHTIVANGETYDFHILPSGLVNPNCINLVGTGCVVHVPSFFAELAALERKGLDTTGRIFVSDRAQLVFDYHQVVDGLKEVELGGKSIGTTRKGIGPAYSSKASRSGVRVHHLVGEWDEFERRFRANLATRVKRYGEFEYDGERELAQYRELADRLRPFVVDAVALMHKSMAQHKRILVEGANALMLDLDFGTYPFVTSSPTSVGGVCTGLGVPPQRLKNIIGVVKAYTTRVGAGPFATEQLNQVGETLQNVGREWGVTTGRKRRCGWLDLVVLQYSTMINGYTSLMLTKLDVLDSLPELKIAVAYKLDGQRLDTFPANLSLFDRIEVEYVTFPGWQTNTIGTTKYEDLPANARAYIEYVEEFVHVPIKYIGVGPGREEVLVREV